MPVSSEHRSRRGLPHRQWARVATVVAGLASGTLGARSAPDAAIVLTPAAGATPAGLTLGLFAPDITLKGAVESLKPDQSWPVTALGVSLNADTGLCGEHTIARILELPNQDKDASNPDGPPDGPECVFGAQLTITAGPHLREIATECGDWVADAAPCWGYGQTGQFRLVREGAAAPARFRLVFPGPGTRVPPGKAPDKEPPEKEAPETAEPANQKHGLFLDTLLDAKKSAKGDLWLVWTGATVELAFTR